MLQRRLRGLNESQRSLYGWGLFFVGTFAVVIGVWFNHYASFPSIETVTFPTAEAATFQAGDIVEFEREGRIVDATPTIDPSLDAATVDLQVEVSPFGWVPRDCVIEGPDWCFPWFTLGHLVALVGSQFMLIGLAIATILGRKMTWARASFAAFIAMFELVMLLGNVASEWLNLAQGPLNWTSQNDAFPSASTPEWIESIWRFVMLGNDVGISWGAIKDIVSINYNMAALTFIIIFAWKIQEWGKPMPEDEPAEPVTSPYGRTLVKASQNGESS